MANREGIPRTLKYDPGVDAAQRYPDWVIRHRPLSHGIPEVLCRRRKVILIEADHHQASKRCSLAHAVAHLDLGHTEIPTGVFERDHELDACHLAARRLITLDDLADALSWTRRMVEVAAELDVDLPTLETRWRNLRGGEQMMLRSRVRWIEEVA